MPTLFDRSLIRRRHGRCGVHHLPALLSERIEERLADFSRPFPRIWIHGAELAAPAATLQIVLTDSVPRPGPGSALRAVIDEECLPFAPESFDLIVTAGSLHWVNDLPGALAQYQRALRAGGLFIGMFPGGRTLWELRESLEAAEIAETGGVSPRVSPFVDVRDGGALLQRAGFSHPVADSETFRVRYGSAWEMLRDIRRLGQTNAHVARQKTWTRRNILLSAMDHYHRHFTDKDGRLNVTLEWITLTGWK